MRREREGDELVSSVRFTAWRERIGTRLDNDAFGTLFFD
jgi:hypothetical protein